MTWLRGLAGLAVLLAVAIGVVFWMGHRLPLEHTARASGSVGASQDKVWELITDTATQPAWRTGLVSISLVRPEDGTPANGLCWIEWQRSMKLPLCITENVPKTRRVVEIADSKLPFGGHWIYDLQPQGPNATIVTITEEGTVRSSLWRFVGHYIMGEDTNARTYLKDLQTEATRKR